MPQTRPLRSLLVTITLVATVVSLSGCVAPEPEPSHCPQEVLDAIMSTYGGPDQVSTIREISADEFLPPSLAEFIEPGCVYEVSDENEQGESSVSFRTAMVPGDDDLFDSIEATVLSHGYEYVVFPQWDDGSNDGVNHATMGQFVAPGANFVTVWTHKHETIDWTLYNGPGFAFLGTEFVLVQSVVHTP